MSGISERLAGSVLLIGCLMVAACGDDEPAPAEVECGQDQASLEMKTTVERVGGLRTDDWVVKLALGTELGVVVLVAGDVDKATPVLVDTHEVAVVEPWEEGQDMAAAFARIRQIVDERCG